MGSLVLKRLLILRSITMKFLVVLAVSVAFVAAAPSGLLPYSVHTPLTYAAHEVHVPHTVSYVQPVQTRVHYESRPVVVGHSTEILKPALGAPGAVVFNAPAVEVVKSAPVVEVVKSAPAVEVVKSAPAVEVVEAAPVVHPTPLVTPYVHSIAAPVHVPAVVDLKAAVPAGDAPPPSELVQTEKVLAPVRAVSKITPELTVQLPTKVNVEKVNVDVPVAAPYANPVPVPVTTHHHVGVSTHTHFRATPTLLAHTY